ncbi:BID domain-containing T4SS effector [Bartonella senegalensis]|uniref:BID domain-containing T4SS effector n=1 Tax=Bartonella senegalensis TaxID=1468418 RepID=UPI000310FCDA|nr:BID domain-containing T4SS effector [Bartonella senegalensis]
MLEHNYLYKNSKTLKNKYGIKDPQRLYERCAHDATREAINFRLESLPQKFDLAYLKKIHWSLFHKSFEWAGYTRDETFTFADGSSARMPAMRPKGYEVPFAVGSQIKRELKQLEQKLNAKNNLQGLSRQEFAENAAEVFMVLDHAHPFRKGNGRTQRMFMEKLGQAAGYNIDFSVITKERLTKASIAAMQHGNIQLMKDLFEDITHPQKSLLLKEFISQMRNSGLEEINEHVVVAAKEGVRYDGIYKGCSAEGFVMELEDGFVVGHKDDLTPEQVKTLQNGDPLLFEKSNVFSLKEILIPKETIPPLTNEQLAERLTNNCGVESYRHAVENLSKRVYGKSSALSEIVDMVNIDPSLGSEFADQIAQNPKSLCKLAGRKVLGIRSPDRRRAEEAVPQLCETLKSYADMVQYTMESFLEQHQREQRRTARSVEKPGRDLQNLFSLSPEQQRETLSHSPALQKQLHLFAHQLQTRLSSEEQRAIQEDNCLRLSCMLGVSESKAKEITKAVKQTKEAQCQMRTLKISRSSARAMTN